MNRKNVLRLIFLVLRLAFAAIFIYAGCAKIPDPASFASSIARFQLLPDLFINPIALGMPVFEILCGLALLAGPWKRQAAFSLAILCGVFLAALVSAWVRGIKVECSCFGGPSHEPVEILILRDIILLAVAVAIYLWFRKRDSNLSL